MVDCGVATVIPRRRTDFFRVHGLESCRKWLRTFFYVKNSTKTDFINLPKYLPGPPLEKHNWDYSPGDSNAKTRQIYKFIKQLKQARKLTPDDLVATFISCRVLPLQHRSHKICQMSGPLDPTRITTVELTNAEIRKKVKAIASTKMSVDWQWGMSPTTDRTCYQR